MPAGPARPGVHNLACPRCGGALLHVDGRRTVDCPYCQTRSYVDGVDFIGRLRLPHINERAAQRVARAALKCPAFGPENQRSAA